MYLEIFRVQHWYNRTRKCWNEDEKEERRTNFFFWSLLYLCGGYLCTRWTSPTCGHVKKTLHFVSTFALTALFMPLSRVLVAEMLEVYGEHVYCSCCWEVFCLHDAKIYHSRCNTFIWCQPTELHLSQIRSFRFIIRESLVMIYYIYIIVSWSNTRFEVGEAGNNHKSKANKAKRRQKRQVSKQIPLS